MPKEININNKTFKDINTTVLYTSEFNYVNDAIEFINLGCSVIDKNNISDIDDIPISLLEEFKCADLLDKEIYSKSEEIKINILNTLASGKETIVFLNVLNYLDDDFKTQVIDYLNTHNKRIINYTSNIEETLLLPYLMVIHDNKIIMEGSTNSILLEDKILTKLGFRLPFIVELSQGLKYYGLTSQVYYHNEELVNDLWK